ncbi:3-oxoacyl-[acyl-carrier protein] reductase [Edaphobacter aggregans]|uniref:3-oxoacyl-[acyl-carrier protein] reductase n=1 Tax=Edaphobacter aggregans TaxID=570835 RepID=A0A3R9P8S9_9BACT|nr:glucose 1-dehydrogenase [Edaphobacter aggregans]RSL16073.1 3-oxoacyl-[acyl-carrier protein] reductase [Edaphobacter aggregans]
MGKLTGKVAVVTGASKGIGAAIARELAKEGAAVVINYASSSKGAEDTVTQITSSGGKAIAVQADVAKATDIERLFAETKKAFGQLDILVNNAGVFKFGTLDQVTEEEFHRHFNTNVLGLLLVSREAAKLFGEQGGSIINIGSTVSSYTPPGSAIYTATKAAVDAITGVLAKELAPRKIRVNSVNPGLTETEGTHTVGMIGGDMQKKREAETPLGRIGQPSDIAPIVAFFASNDSYWLTGEIVNASGGFR